MGGCYNCQDEGGLSLSFSLSLSHHLNLLHLGRMYLIRFSFLGKDYRNDFAWVMRLNRDGQIDLIRAYYDSAHTDVALAPEMKKAQSK